MSRKDYQLIANALAAERRECKDPGLCTLCGVVMSVSRRLADSLALDNPRFDRARFLAACEGKEAVCP